MSNCHHLDEKTMRIESLPFFRISSEDSSVSLCTDQIYKGSPLVFIYFSTDCEHCQKQLKVITESFDKLGKARFFFITNDSFDELKTFCKTNSLKTSGRLFIGKDYDYSFYRRFLPPSVPFIAVYNRQKRLVRIYREGVGIQSLISSVQE